MIEPPADDLLAVDEAIQKLQVEKPDLGELNTATPPGKSTPPPRDSDCPSRKQFVRATKRPGTWRAG
jgi:hypothetical protein